MPIPTYEHPYPDEIPAQHLATGARPLGARRLTVESSHFCVLKSCGAVLNVYEAGRYVLQTPDKPLVGSIAQGLTSIEDTLRERQGLLV